MKKLFLAALLAACVVLPLAAQSGGSGAALLNVGEYVSYFGFNKKEIDNGEIDFANDYAITSFEKDEETYKKFVNLGKDTDLVDTPIEFALLSYYSQPVINIRPVEAKDMLPTNNPRAAGLKLGSAVLKELAELRFLDPSNTAAVGRYEGMIKFISDRNGVSRAEIERHLKQGIAEVVREKFNSIDFRLEKYQKSYAATLSIDPKTSEYILNYGVYDNNEKKISGRNLDALLIAMKSNVDFDARSIEQVQEQAELIPAVIYSSWVEKKMTKVDAVQLAADTIANFYISPTSANYDLLVGVFGLFNRKVEDPVAKAGLEAYRDAIVALNEPLGRKADTDGLNKGAALARAARAYNSDYAIFATPYRK